MSRELDAEVAEKVMGFTRWTHDDWPDMRGKAVLLGPDEAPETRWAKNGWRRVDASYPLTGRERWGRSLPAYSTDIAAAWYVVEHLRDQWTAATTGVSGFDDTFPRPFDDAVFFERLHRHANRRWPWAFLYVTPEAICRAALAAVAGATRP